MTGVTWWAMERKESVEQKDWGRRGKIMKKRKMKLEVKKETGEQRRRRRNWPGLTGPPNVV